MTLSDTCSDAFAWKIGTTYALLTAAHCVSSGGYVKINGTKVGSVFAFSEENWSTTNGTQYYTGQSVYRGDVGLVRLNSSYSSAARIYRGPANSAITTPVVAAYRRYMASGDVVYVSGERTGETGPYTVDLTGWNWLYAPPLPSDLWIRNASSALAWNGPCVDLGDSGGSVFSIVSGGVKAAGVQSGFGPGNCRIWFTDYWTSYFGLQGDILTQ